MHSNTQNLIMMKFINFIYSSFLIDRLFLYCYCQKSRAGVYLYLFVFADLAVW